MPFRPDISKNILSQVLLDESFGANAKKGVKILRFILGVKSKLQSVTNRLAATIVPFGVKTGKAVGSFSHEVGES